MLALISTKETQGQRDNDFCWTDDEELVVFGNQCDSDVNVGPDGGCGCMRSMTGVETRKGTTTVKVAEVDLTVESLADAIVESDKRAGWTPNAEWAAEAAKEIAATAEVFGLGTVLEFRAGTFRSRT